MDISPALAGLIGALGGSFITGFLGYLNNRLTKRSEERKHLKDLLIKLSLELYKQQEETAKKQISLEPLVIPMEMMIIRMMKFNEMFIEKAENCKDSATVINGINELNSFTNEVVKEVGRKLIR